MPPKTENHSLERARHQLRARGIKDSNTSPLRSGIHSRGYLPHVKHEGAEYFITFRLADSLPREVLHQYEAERAERMRLLAQPNCSDNSPTDCEREINRDFRRQMERYLDQGAGACHLRRPQIATLVAGAMRFFHEQRYLLNEWVVMPNHVHAMLWPMPNYLVGDILKTWKQFTSLRAKRLLGVREESFWQRESYDHWIRDDEERAGIARYIRNNPVTAHLCSRPEDWPWSSAYQSK